jgi:xanthine dehydrogenase small subunit
MNTRPVRFFHRGAIVEHAAGQPTRSVLEWLREEARCTGTKEGCAEGDCGACTVVLGSLDAQGALQLQPVNACIQFLPTLDGKALFTVEDVAAADGTLHPAQRCLVDCHGSQCGFCTPGFVMSLWASYQRHGEAPATRQELADELSGNLCRCTGYRPILDAGQRMFQAPRVGFDAAPVVEALKTLAADEPLALPNGFHAPRTVDAFAALLVENPQAKVLAGSTDMGLWVTKQFRALPELISINEVAELKAVKVGDTAIEIGAAASLEAAWRALVGEWPSLRDLWLRFASLPIREAGTMGGNVANGSPIGDSAPVLMALGATIVLRRGTRVRRLPLEDFYLDYMKNALEPGEFVLGLEVPRGTQRLVRAYKISKRFDCDISALCLGASLAIDGDRITAPRLAFGGMAAIVKRASKAEAALNGQPWNEASLAAAQAALAEDFKPLTDMRASAGYRLQVAQNLLKRLWLETRPQGALPDSATSVWAREELA